MSPPRLTTVASITVVLDPVLDGDKRQILEELQVAQHMGTALGQSFMGGAGVNMNVTINQFRVGMWGPSRMHARVDVFDAQGNLIRQFDVDSTSIRGGGTGSKTQVVSQDIIEKICAGM